MDNRHEKNGRREARPSFQMYPIDFFASSKVARMSAEERGVFITIMLRSWTDDGFLMDEDDLADELGLTVERLQEILAGRVGRSLEKDDEGRWRSPRLEIERARAKRLSKARAEAGAKGGKAKSKALAIATEDAAIATEGVAIASNCQALLGKGAGQGRAGQGKEGVQGEITEADPKPDPPPVTPRSPHSFEPPPWIPEDYLRAQIAKAEELSSDAARIGKLTHSTRIRALRLACIQLVGEPPKGWDAPGSSKWRSMLSHKMPGAEAATWLRQKLEQYQPGKSSAGINGYVQGCAEHGPDPDVWLPPGTKPRTKSA